MKYIIFEGGDVVMFTDTINHSDMARMHGGKPKSAGFVRVDIDGYCDEPPYICPYGYSISLGLESQPEDLQKINQQFEY